MRSVIVGLAVVAMNLGCRAPLDEVRPDQMSASAHHLEAQREDARAHQAESAREPAPLDVGLMSEPGAGGAWNMVLRNSSRRDPERVAQIRAHAQAHESAARQLEAFEDDACASINPGQRDGCPLMGPVSGVTEIPTGLRITLAHPEMAPTVIARMRCHLAFARTRHFEVPSCPLYIRGLDIQPGNAPGTIELRGATPAAVQEIRLRAPEQLTIPGPPSASR